MAISPDWELLVGCNDAEMVVCDENTSIKLHKSILPAFKRLQHDAQQAGFDLQVISGYRSFERQLAIWNAKAQGLRPLLSNTGKPLDFESLSEPELLEAIMRWSALPSTSRHHWGTDFDIIDAKALTDGYQVKLTPDECCGDGPFANMHAWLDQRIANHQTYGFFRPYDRDRGGVAPEPWHLSYAPLSQLFDQTLDPSRLKQWLASWPKENPDSAFLLLDAVIDQFESLFERYVSIPKENYPVV